MKIFMKIGFFFLLIIGIFTVSSDMYQISFVQQASAEDFPTYWEGLKETKFGKETAPTVSNVIVEIIKFILNFVGALAVVYIVIAGVMYIVSGGDEKRTDMAKNMIVQAIYGLVVVLLAWVIVNIVSGVVGM